MVTLQAQRLFLFANTQQVIRHRRIAKFPFYPLILPRLSLLVLLCQCCAPLLRKSSGSSLFVDLALPVSCSFHHLFSFLLSSLRKSLLVIALRSCAYFTLIRLYPCKRYQLQLSPLQFTYLRITHILNIVSTFRSIPKMFLMREPKLQLLILFTEPLIVFVHYDCSNCWLLRWKSRAGASVLIRKLEGMKPQPRCSYSSRSASRVAITKQARKSNEDSVDSIIKVCFHFSPMLYNNFIYFRESNPLL